MDRMQTFKTTRYVKKMVHKRWLLILTWCIVPFEGEEIVLVVGVSYHVSKLIRVISLNLPVAVHIICYESKQAEVATERQIKFFWRRVEKGGFEGDLFATFVHEKKRHKKWAINSKKQLVDTY